MRRFLASGWFPFLAALALAGATAGAYRWMAPDPSAIGHSEIAKVAEIAGWAVGPVAGLLSWILAGVLNLIRRIVRLRKAAFLHPLVVLASIAPWVAFAWQITGENRYTPVARAAIDFAGRPLLLGSLVTCLAVIVLSLPLLFPAKK